MAALVPDPAEESLHAPGPEPLWNESYYFDAAAADGSIGVYVRLGRLPNRDEAVYTASIVRAGQPPIMLVDQHAPLPAAEDPRQTITTEQFAAEQECLEPLERYRLTLRGTGESFADSTAPLRGESGDPVDIELDLVWATSGVPYAWRITTRYEIPCQVTGSVTIDGRTVELSAPGQRDHSYGSRDWWANDWTWSAFHLEDGTRTHTVTLPDLPGLAFGYTQRGRDVREIQNGDSTYTDGPSGEPASATITIAPDGPALDVTPTLYGSLLLTAPDGRITHFQRAMATVVTADGRRGVGWIEWNRNQ